MKDHHETALQAVKNFWKYYFMPSSYKVTHRLKSVDALWNHYWDYDLFLLDRDGTLHEYHGSKRAQEFEDTLERIGPKSEIVSNSSFDELKRIRDVFGDLMPVSKVVRFEGNSFPYILRFVGGELTVLKYDAGRMLVLDETSGFAGSGEKLLEKIEHNYKKPDPLIISAVVEANIHESRIPVHRHSVLMVGDRYLTDIVAGNLAGVDTAIVKPYMPFHDRLELIASRYFADIPLGAVMSRLAGNK